MRRWLLAAACLAVSGPVQAAQGSDPLRSVMWETVREAILGAAPVEFDERVKVFAPLKVEDNMNVPVSVRVDGLPGVQEIVILADHNPIPKVLSFFPLQASPYIELRMKVQEATPIRAAARTIDGVWHVGGLRVDAAGGGCTAPSASQASKAWQDHLNELQGKAWKKADGRDRLRLRVVHPMDTGLVSGIPAFFIETMTIAAPDGAVLARLESHEPVSENPVFTFEMKGGGDYIVAGRDNNGNELAARIPAARDGFGLEVER